MIKLFYKQNLGLEAFCRSEYLGYSDWGVQRGYRGPSTTSATILSGFCRATFLGLPVQKTSLEEGPQVCGGPECCKVFWFHTHIYKIYIYIYCI